MRTTTIFAALLAAFTLTASGATLSPISYSMPNGGGFPGYEDETYSSPNCPNCPGYLSGGLGQLTDGITTPSFFPDEGGTFSTMVGWTFDPEIFFYFDSTQSFGQVQIHLSDAHGRAGIALPSSIDILIGSTTLTFNPVAQNETGSLNEWHSFNTQGLSGDSVKVTLHRSQTFEFVDEFAFVGGAAAAPEPSTMILGGTALALVGFLRRKHR